MIVGHAFARFGSLPGTAPAHALHVHLPREVKILMKGIAVPVRDLGGGVTGLASRALAPQTVLSHVDGSALAVTCPAPLLTVCDLGGPGRGPLTATGTIGCAHALGVTVHGHDDCARVCLAVVRPGVTGRSHTVPLPVTFSLFPVVAIGSRLLQDFLVRIQSHTDWPPSP